MQKRLLLAIVPLLVLLNGITSSAQVVTTTASTPRLVSRPILPKKPKPLRTELSVGYRLTSDGWNLYADKGYVISDEPKLSDQFYDLRVFQLEFGEHKDRTQKKRKPVENYGEPTRAFVFGKVNNFYALKLGYGFRKLIAGKPEPGTVSIHWFGTGGFSLGLLKPYYLEVDAPEGAMGTNFVRQSVKYSDEMRPYFLNDRYIIGGSGFMKGIDETKFVPGLHAKGGLHFDFAANKKTVVAVQAGASAELYFQKVQIMARDEGTPYFVNIFAAFQFGKRW